MSSQHHKLCLSLLPETPEALSESVRNIPECDLLEVRIDHLPEFDCRTLATALDLPLIITLRSEKQGGFWTGTAAARQKILQAAASAGPAYLDVEYPHDTGLIPELPLAERTKLILSCHTGPASLMKLQEILVKMTVIPAAVYKLVFTAESLRDNLSALKLQEFAGRKGIPAIIHCQGQIGQPSRLLNAVNGNLWTYVAEDHASQTAPGQISLFEARSYYDLPEKQHAPRLLGLAGFPIQQSRGWRLHNRLLQNTGGRDFLYLNFPVHDFDTFWKDWQNRLHGLSITIPHKESVWPCLDWRSPEVKISGVCNTVIRGEDGWQGYNTDMTAIETLLKPFHRRQSSSGLVIGTGATARSAIAALKRLEVSPIFVVGRNPERGRLLAEVFGIEYLQEHEIHYASARTIVQTTPVGMAPHVDEHPLGTSLFRKDRVVLDVIYNPAETKFLRMARERGCQTVSGVEMFLWQATKQFGIFTGVPVEVEDVRKVWDEIV